MSAEQGLFRRAMVPIAVVGCLAVAYHEGQPGLIVHHDGFNFSVRSPGKPAERDAYSVAVHRQRSETQTATSQDAAASKNDVVIHGIALGWSATTESKNTDVVTPTSTSVPQTSEAPTTCTPSAEKSCSLKIGWVGDSITAGGNGCNEHTVDDAVADLQQADHYTVSSYNEGHSGYGTDDWAAGSVTLADAESVFKSDKVQYVAVMLGTNDTRTPAEYVMADKIAALTPAQHFANMTGIVKSLTNDGFNVVLNEPIYTTPDAAGLFPSDVDTVYSQYWALDSTLANNKNVFIGDTSGITVMGQSGNLCSDGVHPSVAGAAVLGEGWAEGIMNAVHTRGMDN